MAGAAEARARHQAIADSALHTLDTSLERLLGRLQLSEGVSEEEAGHAVLMAVQEAVSGLDERLALTLCAKAIALQLSRRRAAEQGSKLGSAARERLATKSGRVAGVGAVERPRK